MRKCALAATAALMLTLTGCFGQGTTLKQDGQTAPPHGAVGLHGSHILFRGTSHCYVPAGQGHMGVCSPPKTGAAPKLPPTAFGEPGADVSNYQGCVSGAGLGFIIAKDGEGPGGRYHDRFGACTWHAAQSRGIVAGNYWFARNCGAARPQAQVFASWTAGERSSLPGALDYETNDCGLSNQSACNWIRDFGDEYLHDTGFRQYIVYDAPGLWPGCDSIPNGRGWVADLSRGCNATLSGFGGRMTICQWTFHGPFGGDGDRWWSGSPADLVRDAHGPPPAPQAPPQIAFDCQLVNRYRQSGHHDPGSYGAWRLAVHRRDARGHGWGCVPSPHQIRAQQLPPVAPRLVYTRCYRLYVDLKTGDKLGHGYKPAEVKRLRDYIASQHRVCHSGVAS